MATQTDASTLPAGVGNSQTMPLLTPAFNIDPSPATGGGDIAVVGGSALLAQEGPSGTAADIVNQPRTSQISVYTVRKGDTLSGIAEMFDVSVNTIVWANEIDNGVIKPGQTLIILPVTGIEHKVLKGETIAGLAKKYKSNAADIARYNDLAVGASLAVGQKIIIPNGEIGASVAPAPTPKKKLDSHATQIKNIATGKTTQPYLGGAGADFGSYYSWPVEGGRLTQGLHGWNGVDIGAPTGTSIFAAAQGIVIIARSGGGWNGGYGNYVVVEHENGSQTLYAHMSRVSVSAGQNVMQGDVLGKVGTTGEATGPHLHFEIRGATNPFATLKLGSRE